MGRLEAHVLEQGHRERRAPTGGAVEDELFVFIENLFVVGAFRIDPELDHAAGAMKTAGDVAAFLPLADITKIDEQDIRVVDHLDGVGSFDLLDACAGGGHHVGRRDLQFAHVVPLLADRQASFFRLSSRHSPILHL